MIFLNLDKDFFFICQKCVKPISAPNAFLNSYGRILCADCLKTEKNGDKRPPSIENDKEPEQ